MQIIPHLAGTFCTVKMQIFAHNPAACCTTAGIVLSLQRDQYTKDLSSSSRRLTSFLHPLPPSLVPHPLWLSSPESRPSLTSPQDIYTSLHLAPTSNVHTGAPPHTSLHIRWITAVQVKYNCTWNKKTVAQVLMFSHCPIFFFWHDIWQRFLTNSEAKVIFRIGFY